MYILHILSQFYTEKYFFNISFNCCLETIFNSIFKETEKIRHSYYFGIYEINFEEYKIFENAVYLVKEIIIFKYKTFKYKTYFKFFLYLSIFSFLRNSRNSTTYIDL